MPGRSSPSDPASNTIGLADDDRVGPEGSDRPNGRGDQYFRVNVPLSEVSVVESVRITSPGSTRRESPPVRGAEGVGVSRDDKPIDFTGSRGPTDQFHRRTRFELYDDDDLPEGVRRTTFLTVINGQNRRMLTKLCQLSARHGRKIVRSATSKGGRDDRVMPADSRDDRHLGASPP